MRLINGEHLELGRRLLRTRDHAVGAIGNCRIHQHNSSELFGAIVLDVSSDVLNTLRPSNENWPPHAQALQRRVQILRAYLWCVAGRRLRRFTLRTRIEGNYPIGFCEHFDLMAPNVSTCAPAGNEDQSRAFTRLARFKHAQRDAIGHVHHA